MAIKQEQKFGLDYKCELQLKPLVVPQGESFKRSQYHFLPLAVIGALVFIFSIPVMATTYNEIYKTYALWFCFLGVGLMLLSSFVGKKLKTAFYYNHENSYIFDITENKHDRENFDIFINTINQRITELQKNKEKTEQED